MLLKRRHDSNPDRLTWLTREGLRLGQNKGKGVFNPHPHLACGSDFHQFSTASSSRFISHADVYCTYVSARANPFFWQQKSVSDSAENTCQWLCNEAAIFNSFVSFASLLLRLSRCTNKHCLSFFFISTTFMICTNQHCQPNL